MEISLNSSDNISLLEIKDGDGSRTYVDRNTKKVHFKEENGEEITDMLVESGPSPILSWKDKLLGNKSGASNKLGLDNSGAGADEDLEFLEGDIYRSIVNGIPAIDFSKRIQQILFKEMEHMSTNDYVKVPSQSPWLIYGQYLTVQPWTKELNPLQPYPSMVMAWIRLLGLPGSLYKMKIIEEIGETIGKVVWLDFNTDSRIRGRFARMAYEALPTIYFTCKKYRHTKELCAAPQSDSVVRKDQKGTTLTKAVSGGESAIYGPWMVVKRKVRRNSRNNNVKKIDFMEKGKSGSRFDALVNMEVLVDLKDKLNKKDTQKLAGFKNKLKVGENVGQQGFKTWGNPEVMRIEQSEGDRISDQGDGLLNPQRRNPKVKALAGQTPIEPTFDIGIVGSTTLKAIMDLSISTGAKIFKASTNHSNSTPMTISCFNLIFVGKEVSEDGGPALSTKPAS
ncbi:hypothetical protein Gogos_000825, partial [Gossypium gossypioides]|nr:hypothetical protein [Gossypium gossypioides]